MTDLWPILIKYTQVQKALSGSTSGKGHKPTQARRGKLRMRQVRRQPIRRRRPRLFWMNVKGWLRQRDSFRKDNYCSEIIFVLTTSS
jgi:hypothetical protein